MPKLLSQFKRSSRPLVGVATQGFTAWAGGAYYLINIAKSLQLSSSFDLVLVRKISIRSALRRMTPADDYFFNEIKSEFPEIKVYNYYTFLDLTLICFWFNIRAIGPLMVPISSMFPIPWFAWIADFQHRHFPHLFSQSEIQWRDRAFGEIARRAPAILVSTGQPLRDIQKFFNADAQKLFPLPVMFAPRSEWLEDKRDLSKIYNLPKKYFLCSNQFHLHKNHHLLFKAFSIFKKSHRDVALVCTGSINDYRDPKYFDETLELLRELDLSDDVIILGMIPKNDQMNLMSRSLAVVQPSLFEGGPGGGAAFDAESLGKMIILSNTEVNLESDYSNAHFFDAYSVQSLVDKLDEVYNYVSTKAARQSCAEHLRQQGDIRLRNANRILDMMVMNLINDK